MKFRFFLFAPAMANFVDFTPLRNSYRPRVSDLQNPTRTHVSRLSAAHTVKMSLFYQTITFLCEGDSESLVTLAPGLN
jgi:hypothetical protein